MSDICVLGGVVLPTYRMEFPFVSQIMSEMVQALDGTPIIQSAPKSEAGRYIDLVGESDGPYTKYSDLVNLFDLLSVLGAVYLLEHQQGNFHVVFRVWEDKPIEYSPFITYADPIDTDPYVNIRIKLMETKIGG